MPSNHLTPACRRKRNAAVATITNTDPQYMAPEQLRLRQLIIDTADSSYRQKGIKKVTMDEVSKNIHMSKRTLYQFFREKEELVLACVKNNLDREQQFITQISVRSANALEVILRLLEYRIQDFSAASDYYLREINRYPTVAQYFKTRRAQSMSELVDLLNIGVEQGVFVDNINFEVFSKCMGFLSDSVLQRERGMEEFSISDYMRHFVVTLFRGCATDKGRQIIDEFCQQHCPN